ncbi:MAG: hypothetical protein J07AB43_12030 [Candidatus Nanosalina sp. J07AB43]|nr:MAG: hypothetical protein J07AB43_12030 [Candidatus Nanosalina sp. J07AB43]
MSTTSEISSRIPELFDLVLALYLADQAKGIFTGVLVFSSSFYILSRLSSKQKFFDTLGMLVHPAKSAILILLLGVTYLGVQGYSLLQILLGSLGFFVFGGAAGCFVYSYWNI